MSDSSKQQPEKTQQNKAAGIITFIIFIAIVGFGVHALLHTKPAAFYEPPTPTPASDVSAAPSTSSQPAAAPQTLLDISGQGTKQTQKFTTAGDWTLSYSYDCSKFGSEGNFQTFTYNDDGSMDSDDIGVNRLGTSGSDTMNYYDAGTHYLSINSECSWRVTVEG